MGRGFPSGMWFFPSPLTPPQRPPRSPGAETPAPRDGAEGGGGHEASSGRGSERSGGLSPPPRCSGRPKDGGCSSCRPLNDMEVLDPPPLPQQRLGAGRCWSRAFLLPPPPPSLPVRWGDGRRGCSSRAFPLPFH